MPGRRSCVHVESTGGDRGERAGPAGAGRGTTTAGRPQSRRRGGRAVLRPRDRASTFRPSSRSDQGVSGKIGCREEIAVPEGEGKPPSTTFVGIPNRLTCWGFVVRRSTILRNHG